jgi:hypothetical protein
VFSHGASRLVCLLLAMTAFASASAVAGEPAVTDPTAPPHRSVIVSTAEAATAKEEFLLLHSTKVAASSRSAVINNHVVAVGSRIDGAVVTSIEQGQVTLTRGPESIVLRLILPPVKRHAKDAG